jgi:hypothetical protein
MKLKYKYVWVILFIFLLVSIVFLTCCHAIPENFENIKVDIGNFFNSYFFRMSIAFMDGKDYYEDVPEQEFIKYIPKYMPFDNELRQMLLDNQFTKEELDKENNNHVGTWTVNNNRRGLYWKLMKPFIHEKLENAFIQSGLKDAAINETKNKICIHFRCSDVPFIRMGHYFLQKYSYFKECLDQVSYLNYKTIKLVSCQFHKGSEENKNACDKYLSSLVEYLSSLGYTVEMQCKSNVEDFASLFYAPVVISTGGSYSFMSGFFGNGIFLSEGHGLKEDETKCTECEWLKSGYSLNHEDVKDYYDTDNVISILKS